MINKSFYGLKIIYFLSDRFPIPHQTTYGMLADLVLTL